MTLNTDNRMVSATNLSKEYEKISAWYPDFSLSDFEKINHYAIDGAFIGQEEKEELHQRFTKEYKKSLNNQSFFRLDELLLFNFYLRNDLSSLFIK